MGTQRLMENSLTGTTRSNGHRFGRKNARKQLNNRPVKERKAHPG